MQHEPDWTDKLIPWLGLALSYVIAIGAGVRGAWALIRKPIEDRIEAEGKARMQLAQSIHNDLATLSIRQTQLDGRIGETEKAIHEGEIERLESLVTISTRLGTIEGLLQQMLKNGRG
jgi:hypothetical protein